MVMFRSTSLCIPVCLFTGFEFKYCGVALAIHSDCADPEQVRDYERVYV